MCSVTQIMSDSHIGTQAIGPQSLMPLLMVSLRSTSLWVIALLNLDVLKLKWWGISSWEYQACTWREEPRIQRIIGTEDIELNAMRTSLD